MGAGELEESSDDIGLMMGIDLGSLHARVAVLAGDGKGGAADVSVVSNPQGQRYTPALSAPERHEEHGEANGNGGTEGKEEKHVIFGESARKYLEAKKLKVADFVVNHQISKLEDNAAETDEDESTWLVREFMAHLVQMALDASSSSSSADASSGSNKKPSRQTLRCVVSVPQKVTTTHATSLVYCTEKAVRSLFGSDTPSNGGQASPSAYKKNKKNKKRGKNHHNQNQKQLQPSKSSDEDDDSILLLLLSTPAAVCVAHGLTERNTHPQPNKASKQTTTSDKDSSQRIVLGATHKNPTINAASWWKRCLVIDWGASGITATVLEPISYGQQTATTTKSQLPPCPLLSILSSIHEPSCSGAFILEVLCKHVATTFERKNRITPPGTVWDRPKSAAKLRMACTDVIRTLSRTASTAVSVDGLYDGIDLNATVSRPRLEMLLSATFRKAKEVITSAIAAASEASTWKSAEVDVVLTCGSVCDMPAAKRVIDSIFPPGNDNGKTSVWRGDSTIPAEEAVAVGCAVHAGLLTGQLRGLSASTTGNQNESNDEDLASSSRALKKDSRCPKTQVDVSPVGLALALVKAQDVTETTIARECNTVPFMPARCPLPFRSCQVIDLTERKDYENVLVILQTDSNKEDGEVEAASPTIVCKMNVPQDAKELVLSVHLSGSGKLSLSVNGGEEIII